MSHIKEIKETLKYLIIILLLLSCTKSLPDHWERYTTKEGKNDASLINNPLITRKSSIAYGFRFPGGLSHYKHTDTTYQDSWNKLPGFFKGREDHEQLAWRKYQGKYQVAAHVHTSDTSIYHYLVDVDSSRKYMAIISRTQKGTSQMFVYNDVPEEIAFFECARSNREHMNYVGLAGVYFGGKYPAPKDVSVDIKWLFRD